MLSCISPYSILCYVTLCLTMVGNKHVNISSESETLTLNRPMQFLKQNLINLNYKQSEVYVACCSQRVVRKLEGRAL